MDLSGNIDRGEKGDYYEPLLTIKLEKADFTLNSLKRKYCKIQANKKKTKTNEKALVWVDACPDQSDAFACPIQNDPKWAELLRERWLPTRTS